MTIVLSPARSDIQSQKRCRLQDKVKCMSDTNPGSDYHPLSSWLIRRSIKTRQHSWYHIRTICSFCSCTWRIRTADRHIQWRPKHCYVLRWVKNRCLIWLYLGICQVDPLEDLRNVAQIEQIVALLWSWQKTFEQQAPSSKAGVLGPGHPGTLEHADEGPEKLGKKKKEQNQHLKPDSSQRLAVCFGARLFPE